MGQYAAVVPSLLISNFRVQPQEHSPEAGLFFNLSPVLLTGWLLFLSILTQVVIDIWTVMTVDRSKQQRSIWFMLV